MMQLQCALVGGRSGPFSIDIDGSLTIEALKQTIVKELAGGIQCLANDLLLYSAKTKDGWLSPEDPSAKAMATPDEINSLLVDPIDTAVSISAAFAGAVAKDAIHVLVVDPKRPALRTRTIDQVYDEQAVSAWEPPLKKPALTPNTVTRVGPVEQDAIVVPFESIDAYRRIKRGLAKCLPPGSDRPLFLLCGPIRFGKVSIARRIKSWIDTNPHLSDVKCVSLVPLRKPEVNDIKAVWSKLGKLFDAQSACADQESFFRLATRDQKRFCLIVEDMDQLLESPVVASEILAALRKWKQSTGLFGYLGVGSLDLLHRHKMCEHDGQPSPFDPTHILRAQPFSQDQMTALFELLEPTKAFPPSLQLGIMDYSSGAPGVFGSLVRYTIDQDKWRLEWGDWEAWFKKAAYPIMYLEVNFPRNFLLIRFHLQQLSELEWDALTFVLQNHGQLSICDVEAKCGIDTPHAPGKSVVDPLLRSGVVMPRSGDGKLVIVSKLVHRLCIETAFMRESKQIGDMMKPIELLVLGLRSMNVNSVARQIAKNQHAHYESVFHFELFRSIQGIFRHSWFVRKVSTTVKALCVPDRADIFLHENKHSLAFDFRSNLVSESDITAAVEQAEAYRLQFNVERMIVVNFVPPGPKIEQMQYFPEIEIVHVQFAAACDLYDLFFLNGNGTGKVKHRNVKLRPTK